METRKRKVKLKKTIKRPVKKEVIPEEVVQESIVEEEAVPVNEPETVSEEIVVGEPKDDVEQQTIEEGVAIEAEDLVDVSKNGVISNGSVEEEKAETPVAEEVKEDKNETKPIKMRGKKKSKKLLYSIIGVVIALVVVIAVSCVVFLGPVDSKNGVSKEVYIPEGSYLGSIASELKKDELIKNEFAFKVYVRLTGRGNDLKAGYYSMSQKSNVSTLVKALVKGGTSKTETITIKEGYDLNRIGKLFEKKGVFTKKEFLAEIKNNADYYRQQYDFLESVPKDREYILEGYLFADTYDVYVKAPPRAIICRMLDRFNEVYTEEYKQRTKELGKTIDEIVIMASIVEREGILADELPTIASVFYNRLKINMPLQSCATLQYIYKDYQFSFTESQKNIDSPYNTYKNAGLPAGPISNFREEALKAALYPADTKYLYFCTKNDGTGGSAFAKDYKEHQKNIDKYSGNWE